MYEREAAVDERSQGYRIHLDTEGDRALHACLPPELYEQVVATSSMPGTGVTFLDPQLNVIRGFTVPPGDESAGQHLVVDRITLRNLLVAGLDVTYGASFERYELLDNGRVRTFFTGAPAVDADLLVAADGTHSAIRKQLLPGAEVVETGQFLTYGKTWLTEEVRALAPAPALEGFSVVNGTDGRFMPVAAFQSRAGGDDYLMWVVGAPDQPSTGDGHELRRAAAEQVADWHPCLAALVRLGDPATVHTTTIRTAKPVPPWQTVPVTLMGDAIHTMVPTGTSAAVALHDAALLCRHLIECDGSLLDAVHQYEAEMLEHGFAAVTRSLQGV